MLALQGTAECSAHLCGCGAMYSSFTRISSGILASRRMMVFTMTQVLQQHSDVSSALAAQQLKLRPNDKLVLQRQVTSGANVCSEGFMSVSWATGASPGRAPQLAPSGWVADEPVAAGRYASLLLEPGLHFHHVTPAVVALSAHKLPGATTA